MRIDSRMRILLFAACCAACGGCGAIGGSGPSEQLVPVKGKVTYQGKPVTKGSVKFEPDGFGRSAFGQIQSDGSFVLRTDKPDDGVIAGHHRVTVTGTGIRSPKDALAKKLASPAVSGLTADVDPEHTEFSFDLK